MKLNDITELIIENAEALIPHLRKEVIEYIELRKKAYGKDALSDWKPPGMALSNNMPLPGMALSNKIALLPKDIDTAVEYALRADPRYLKDARKKKPLNKTKSPFARSILKWWLDPRAGGGIELPEDILVVSEVLQKFNLAKQVGLQGNPSDFDKWDDLVDTVTKWLPEGAELAPDALARLGLETIFESKPWKVYVINEWDPGEPDPNSMYPDRPVHKAFEGTGVCVKHQGTFESYGPPYYLVMRGARRFALIHYPTTQFKTMQNRRVSAKHFEEGLDFLQRFFASHPDHLVELSLNSLRSSCNNADHSLGDFREFALEEKGFASEIKEILNTPAARTAAERDARLVIRLAKLINEWPHFSSWPEGLNTIIGKNAPITDRHRVNATGWKPSAELALKELVMDRGRMPEIEGDMDFDYFKSYVGWLLEGLSRWCSRDVQATALSAPPWQQARIELTKIGRNLAQKTIGPATSVVDKMALGWGQTRGRDYDLQIRSPLRSGVNWLSVERKLWHGRKIQPWPEMEQHVLNAEEPRTAVAWATLMYDGKRWREGEPIIATDDRAIDVYDRITGMHLKNKEFANMDDPQTIVKRAIQTGREYNDKESIILQDLNAAVSYAKHIIGPWPELEKKLESEPELQDKYRQEVLHGFYDE